MIVTIQPPCSDPSTCGLGMTNRTTESGLSGCFATLNNLLMGRKLLSVAKQPGIPFLRAQLSS